MKNKLKKLSHEYLYMQNEDGDVEVDLGGEKITINDALLDDLFGADADGLSLQDTERQNFLIQRNDGDYLFNKGFFYNPDMSISGNEADKLIEWLSTNSPIKTDSHRIFLRTLIANFILQHGDYGIMGYFGIQTGKSVWTTTTYNPNIKARAVNTVLNYYLKIGLLKKQKEAVKGSWIRYENSLQPFYQKGMTARYDFSSTLYEAIYKYKVGLHSLIYIGNPIKLNGKEKAKQLKENPIPYNVLQLDNFERIKFMESYNGFLFKQEIILDEKKVADRSLIRDFCFNYPYNFYTREFNRGRFDRGGRFFSHWILQTKKALRKHLRINDNPTIELDYSCMNMQIMCSLTNQYDLNNKDLYQYKGLKNLDREWVKQFITIAPNVKTSTNCMLTTVNHKLFGGSKRAKKEEHYKKIDDVPKKYRDLVEDINKAIQETFPTLHKTFFFKGKKEDYAVQFMNHESNIAELVIRTFLKKKITVLPIHDAFIVEKEHKDLLRFTMIKAFRDYFEGLKKHPSIPAIK
jgi:hypothetical protein